MAPALSVVFACVAVGSVRALKLTRVDPELDPKTDKQHQKDYPLDARPEVVKGWKFDHLGGHPYPTVSKAAVDYDSDYVKDENGDGGEWNAQMNYDTLRSQVAKEQKEADLAKKQMLEQKERSDKAAQEESAAEVSSENAEKMAAEAKDAEKSADAVVEKLTGKDEGENQTTVGGELGGAAGVVETEMKDLDDCKARLAAAKDRLKELVTEKAAREAAAAAAAAAAANASNNGSSNTSAKVSLKTLQDKYAKAKAEHQAAVEDMAQQEEDVVKTQEAVVDAKKKLEAARNAPRGPLKASSVGFKDNGRQGTSHQKDKSAAAAISVLSVALMLAGTVVMA